MKIRVLTDKGIGFGFRRILGRYFWRYDRSIKILFGPGAGYIGGSTLYLALNCKGTDWRRMYKRRFLQIGWTRNANRVPFCSH